jgi:hypothetical protein
VILYLDVQRAAQATCMSVRWIRAQVRNGLPCLDTGGKLLLDPDVLKDWMTSRFTPKIVDLEAAHEMAAELISGRCRGRKAAR